MPLSSTCRNCGLSKTPDYYAENYCKDCLDAIKASRELASKDNLDMGAATRSALAERAHNVHRNHVDPRAPVSKSQYWQPIPPE